MDWSELGVRELVPTETVTSLLTDVGLDALVWDTQVEEKTPDRGLAG